MPGQRVIEHGGNLGQALPLWALVSPYVKWGGEIRIEERPFIVILVLPFQEEMDADLWKVGRPAYMDSGDT